MRTLEDIQNYSEQLYVSVIANCKKCFGNNSKCSCFEKYKFLLSMYEACIPKDFWNIEKKDITHNKLVFDNIILKYVLRLNKALSKGYGLVLLGDNGAGKTYFLSYILAQAVKKRRTVYYTTLPQLEHDITLGFNNKDKLIQKRIDLFLTSDFVAIDEVAKEKRKNKKKKQSFMDVQMERILKQRYDDNMPVLLAANMDRNSLMNAYNSTIESMLVGKYKIVQMEHGDHRKKMTKKMSEEMGY